MKNDRFISLRLQSIQRLNRLAKISAWHTLRENNFLETKDEEKFYIIFKRHQEILKSIHQLRRILFGA